MAVCDHRALARTHAHLPCMCSNMYKQKCTRSHVRRTILLVWERWHKYETKETLRERKTQTSDYMNALADETVNVSNWSRLSQWNHWIATSRQLQYQPCSTTVKEIFIYFIFFTQKKSNDGEKTFKIFMQDVLKSRKRAMQFKDGQYKWE